MISVPSSAFGTLRQELINTLGLPRAKGFLLRYGWNCGVSDSFKGKGTGLGERNGPYIGRS